MLSYDLHGYITTLQFISSFFILPLSVSASLFK
jgi:hypothetical protein